MSLNSQTPVHAAAVTPSDSADAYGVALYVGSPGSVSMITEGGDSVAFAGVPGGTTLVVRFSRINLTGTTAGNLVRLW